MNWSGLLAPSHVNTGFVACFVAYAVLTVWSNRREPEPELRRTTKSAAILQLPLFMLALMLAIQFGAFTRALVSPLHIASGVVAGHLIFTCSLLVTHQQARDVARHLLDFRALWQFVVENPSILFRFIGVSFTEELIYRAAAQPLLMELGMQPLIAILVTAVVFSVVHWHFFRNPPLQSVEFMAFALLLGALYYWTNSLSLVVAIHTLRNLEIVYLEYLIKVDELSDEQRALEELERQYAPRPRNAHDH